MPNHDPYLDNGMRLWIAKMAHRNYGRVANYDARDLIQDGYCCYYKCKNRYVGKKDLVGRDGVTPGRYLSPDNPDKVSIRHFQALVKTTFSNFIATLVFKQPSGWEQPISALQLPEQSTEQAWESIMPTTDEEATATMLLRSAPTEIKQLFALLVDDAINLGACLRSGGKRKKYARLETTNEYYCRLLGLPTGFNIVEAVDQHFLR